jgi:hypothetical protein
MKTHDHDLVQDFDELAHPSEVFDHPREVVSDPDLSLNEKRAILASWASDACAIEAAPALRQTPGGRVVPFDEIMDAMRALDGEVAAVQSLRWGSGQKTPRPVKRRMLGGQGNQGAPLH